MNIKVKIDNEYLNFGDGSQPPRVVNERVLIPVSDLLQCMSYDTEWRAETGYATDGSPTGTQVFTNTDGNTVTISEGEATFLINDVIFPFFEGVASSIIGGSFMVPIRSVLENLGYRVEWDGENNTVVITSFPTQYTVTYDANGGNFGISETLNFTVAAGGTVTLPSPVHADLGSYGDYDNYDDYAANSKYEFAGWYTAASGGTKIGDAGDLYTVNSDITLYARWVYSNHTANTAQNITANEIVSRNIVSSEVADYYRITFDGRGDVEFCLKVPENARYNMYLYDEDDMEHHIAHMGGGEGVDRSFTRAVENKSYVIKVYAPDEKDINPVLGYELRVNPVIATGITLNFENSTYVTTNTYTLEYSTVPENAYTECTFVSSNSSIIVNENVLTASEDVVTIVTVTDLCSKISDSKLLIFDLLPANYTITMPSGKICNWNQKHEGVTTRFGSSACTLVAGLDVANFYSTNEGGYTPEDMDSEAYWLAMEGYRWRIPGPGYLKSKCTFADSFPDEADSTAREYILQQYIRYIKKEIYAGKPIIVNLGPSRDNNHSVVAYRYMDTPIMSRQEEPTEMNKIMVYDPENGGDNTNIHGRDVTLWEAFRYSFISNSANPWKTFWIWSLRPTDTN